MVDGQTDDVERGKLAGGKADLFADALRGAEPLACWGLVVPAAASSLGNAGLDGAPLAVALSAFGGMLAAAIVVALAGEVSRSRLAAASAYLTALSCGACGAMSMVGWDEGSVRAVVTFAALPCFASATWFARPPPSFPTGRGGTFGRFASSGAAFGTLVAASGFGAWALVGNVVPATPAGSPAVAGTLVAAGVAFALLPGAWASTGARELPPRGSRPRGGPGTLPVLATFAATALFSTGLAEPLNSELAAGWTLLGVALGSWLVTRGAPHPRNGAKVPSLVAAACGASSASFFALTGCPSLAAHPALSVAWGVPLGMALLALNCGAASSEPNRGKLGKLGDAAGNFALGALSAAGGFLGSQLGAALVGGGEPEPKLFSLVAAVASALLFAAALAWTFLEGRRPRTKNERVSAEMEAAEE
ncbi:MAG: hypothetical protein Kow0069_39200 [Promethearchaeota archaeon]